MGDDTSDKQIYGEELIMLELLTFHMVKKGS